MSDIRPLDLGDEAAVTGFIERHTAVACAPLVPELRLHLADPAQPLWHMGEEEISALGLPAPFWAFAWAGGQALARHVLDHPGLVAGRHVIDFASGSAIAGLAAARCGAARVLAADIDPFAAVAARLNAYLNALAIEATARDLLAGHHDPADVILAGDIWYEQPLAGRVLTWLRDHAARGALVLVGDPGRGHIPDSGIECLATYRVETTEDLEDHAVRRTSVWRIKALT